MTLDKNNFWLNIDKPEGYSSAKVVSIVKKITGSKKVGHAGTLDPFATGVLPIAVGKATKTCDYIVSETKKYYFEIVWGEFRDSDDKTGNVIESSSKRPSTLEITNALSNFIGEISQVPSSFSAIKVNGQKSYDLARLGIAVPLKARLITINKIHLIFNNQERAGFELTCSKGTYIRSFAKDLAKQIGVCGYVDVLRRLQVGNFCVQDGISLDKLKNIVQYAQPNNSLLQLRDVLNFIPEIEINTSDALLMKNGQFIKLDLSNSILRSEINHKITVKVIYQGVVIALASLENSLLKPLNNF